MAEVTFDARAFSAGLAKALRDMRDEDGADYLQTLGDAVLEVAEAKVRRRSGAVAGGLGMEQGEDASGPYVLVGVLEPPKDRHDFFLEFGTYKDPPQPYMRPALAAVASGISLAGGGTRRRGSATSRGVAKRARLRRAIRTARRRGVTAGEARVVSRAVSNRYRTQRRRRR